MHFALIDALHYGAFFIFGLIGNPVTTYGDGFEEMFPEGWPACLTRD